ncbi:MAG: hypothetical protein ACK6DZ_00365, partial [Acidobacteriota bacterium]
GKRELVVGVMTGLAAEEPKVNTRRFPSTNRGIEDLAGWMIEEGCMQSWRVLADIGSLYTLNWKTCSRCCWPSQRM